MLFFVRIKSHRIAHHATIDRWLDRLDRPLFSSYARLTGKNKLLFCERSIGTRQYWPIMFDPQNVKRRTFRQLAYNRLATHHPVHGITTRQASIALSEIFLFLLAAPAQVVDVEVKTSKNLDNVPEVAGYITDELVVGDIPRDNIEIAPIGETTEPIA